MDGTLAVLLWDLSGNWEFFFFLSSQPPGVQSKRKLLQVLGSLLKSS